MTLSTANTAHNFYPYFTNFSSNNYFQHHNFEFNPGTIGATHSTTDQSAFAVVRATSANAKGTVVGVDYYDQYAITPRMAIQDGKQSFTSYYWASGGPAAGSNSTQKQSTNQLPINQSSVL
ncbi:hypothetical protein FACS1894176_01290 [Bacteroidia bacterium]|nr:hypothetical protein FACS1894176_01290 [Bacteroidia bacterium]